MDSNTSKLFKNIADSASSAAQAANEAMQNAGKAVADKYDLAKISLELSRIKAEQERIFADIGREVYLVNTGARKLSQNNEESSPKNIIDPLILAAEQKQQEIDALQDKQALLNNSNKCSACGHSCLEKDLFCSSCGAKL